MPSLARSLSLTSALVLACLVVSNCQKVVKSFAEISKLREAIVKEYGEKDVGVNLNNGTTLTITFINSPLNAKTQRERAERAMETAIFVTQHYPSIAQINEIWVGFIKQETHFVVMHYTESLGFIAFDNNARPLREPKELRESTNRAATILPADLEPIAVYSPALKQTEVKITRLQLEGDLNYGFAVAPHFNVPGDVTGVRIASSPPRSVNFDFASYSAISMFPGKPKITFLVDGKVVFETSEQFSTSKTTEGNFSEFLLLEIPYPAFRRLIAGRTLRLTVGDREYDFTDEQVRALRRMTKYISS